MGAVARRAYEPPNLLSKSGFNLPRPPVGLLPITTGGDSTVVRQLGATGGGGAGGFAADLARGRLRSDLLAGVDPRLRRRLLSRVCATTPHARERSDRLVLQRRNGRGVARVVDDAVV